MNISLDFLAQILPKVTQDATPNLAFESQAEEKRSPFSIEFLAVFIVGGIGGILAFIGVIYTLFCKFKVNDKDEESSSDDDQNDENEILETKDLR